ncbi:MAG: SLC13 family permease [Hyphomicrobiaceae bacterium]
MMSAPVTTNEPSLYGRRSLGLLAGPLIAATMLVAPPQVGMSQEAWQVAAVALLMAIWWMTEALPLPITALLPLVLFPLLGTAEIEAAAAPHSHPLIFLFLGGFLLARAAQKWGLDRRLTHIVLSSGSREAAGLILSLMIATAFLSMWVSNTATAMLMLPIGQSVIAAVQRRAGDRLEPEVAKFSAALMLGIGYAASIGGMGTLIGTPPNALFAAFMRETYGVSIGFAAWMLVGVPAVVILLPLSWLVLTRGSLRFSLPALDRGIDASEGPLGSKLSPMSSAERVVAIVMGLTAIAWMMLPLLQAMLPRLKITDAGIAVAAAILLFLLPAVGKGGEPLLTWQDARRVRWDVLILFGGGLSLAEAIRSSSLAAWLGEAASALGALPLLGLVLAVAVLVILLGELASNTAITAIFLPVAAATAVGIGVEPAVLAMTVALAASVGFMLPVATPPNAIVYGSGLIRIEHMLKVGVILDLAGAVIVAFLAVTVGSWALRS